MDDCLYDEPRTYRRLRAMHYIEQVHREGVKLGIITGIGLTLWLGGMVGLYCWLASQ